MQILVRDGCGEKFTSEWPSESGVYGSKKSGPGIQNTGYAGFSSGPGIPGFWFHLENFFFDQKTEF